MALPIKVFLSSFWVSDLGKGWFKRGEYNLDNCGGPNDWTLGTDPRPDNALWTVEYTEKRYVYVFEKYGGDPVGEIDFFTKLRQIGITPEDLTLVLRNFKVYVYQTNHLFPGWDTSTYLWDNTNPDELGGNLDLIDTDNFTTEPVT